MKRWKGEKCKCEKRNRHYHIPFLPISPFPRLPVSFLLGYALIHCGLAVPDRDVPPKIIKEAMPPKEKRHSLIGDFLEWPAQFGTAKPQCEKA